MTWKQYYIDFAVFLIRDGARSVDVAAVLSIAPAMVYALLKSRGYVLKDLKTMPPMPQKERTKIIKEFCAEKKNENALRAFLATFGISFDDFAQKPLSSFYAQIEKIINRCKRTVSERDQAIAELRRNGTTLKDIGQQYGITRERVRQVVLMYNRISDNPVDIDEARRLGYRPTPERLERLRRVVQLCRKGLTYRQIADTLGVEKKYVFQDVARHNLTAAHPIRANREENRKITDKVRQMIVQGRLKGITNYVLSERFGVSYGTICRVIKEEGLTRPRRNPKKTTKRVKTVKKNTKKKNVKRGRR